MTSDPTLTPAKDLLLSLFNKGVDQLTSFLLHHSYFVHPERLRQHFNKHRHWAYFPNCVRESNQYHKGKHKGQESHWEGRAVRVCDNTKARLAFSRFSGLVLAGNKDDRRIRGYHVAHVWERVYDPECFTAGWNLCLMPGFLKLFTEQQDRMTLLHEAIEQAAFDLFFRGELLGLRCPAFVRDHGRNLKAEFPNWVPNVLSPR